MIVRKSVEGFTLVELSLSIAFIAILSITVTLIINNAISTYARGLTLNQINTVGMDLVDDIRGEVQNSPINSVCSSTDVNSKCFEENIFVEKKIEGGEMEGVQKYGAFCTGRYSYVWNSGYFFVEDNGWENTDKIVVEKEGFEGGDKIRLLKVKDGNREVCNSINNGETKITIDSNVSDDDVVELLSKSNNLVLYDFSVAKPATNDNGSVSFYPMSFILGTIQGGANVMAAGDFCEAPESNDAAENFDYCAINKFNFAAQAIGG